MKTQKIIIVVLSAFLLSCNSVDKNPLEGTWKLIEFKFTFPDSTVIEYPGNVTKCYSSWMLSGSNSLWYYKYKTDLDTVYSIDFGDMTYTFDGKTYKETYLATQDEKFIGQTFTYEIEIKNDTLTLSGPAPNEVEKLGCTVYEVLVRSDER
ncbi:MAG: hypothetical protein ABFS35_02840 [Bacteroidota bacterium]